MLNACQTAHNWHQFHFSSAAVLLLLTALHTGEVTAADFHNKCTFIRPRVGISVELYSFAM
jgi:hypothetical protein